MVYAVAATRPQGSPWVSWAAFAVLRMLAASVLRARLRSLRVHRARTRTARWAMLIAAGFEAAVMAYMVVHWWPAYFGV